jgi:undecaprenyl-diphosphatase
MNDLIILSIIQGITEFLPVSSTAHMILSSKLFGIQTLGRITEAALHFGTVSVVLAYFWKDILTMLEGLLSALKGKLTPGFWLFIFLCSATMPAVIGGFMIHKYAHELERSFPIIGWASIISGVVLYAADKNCVATKTLDTLSLKDALLIGLMQVIAFIPGASRSGSTIIGARLLGYKRTDAARFSFLLSVPAILGAITLTAWDFLKEGSFPYSSEIFIAISVSFGVGLLILSLMFWWLKRYSFLPIALYRMAFGIFILWYF